MKSLKLSAVMKTDIRGYTTKVGMMNAFDLGKLLKEHKAFISEKVAAYEGSIIKGEGDSFWIVFSSVTKAAICALEIQDDLLAQQAGRGDEDRLAVRIVITAGDILFADEDIFGETVNMTARIESLTPADEVYLSEAAWMSLNRAEVQTRFVGEYNLKGINKPERIFRINREHRTRIVKDQAIVFTDMSDYTTFSLEHGVSEVENILNNLDRVHTQTCQEHGGTIRLIMGDCYFMTFPETVLAMEAIANIDKLWDEFRKGDPKYEKNRLTIGIHHGDLYHYRSALYGKDINTAAGLYSLAAKMTKKTDNVVFVSESIKEKLADSPWVEQLEEIEIPENKRVRYQGKVFQLRGR